MTGRTLDRNRCRRSLWTIGLGDRAAREKGPAQDRSRRLEDDLQIRRDVTTADGVNALKQKQL